MDRTLARIFRSLLLIAVVTILPAQIALAAQVNDSNSKAAPDSAVDHVFADLQKPGSPGCALGVYRNGQIIYSRGYGLASVELDAPITPQTVFDIGSTSKQFTAASILLLEEEGKLSLNDDIRKYIPELPNYGHKITILNLLNHTSGIRDYLTLLVMAGNNIDSVTTDQDALALVARQKHLNFAPGTQFLYSNTGFFLQSLIVKRVSGMTLEQFAAQNIFTPLGMMQTTYRDDHTLLLPHRALAYDPAGPNRYKLNVSYFEQLGDGAVHTSVDDLVKWDENFYTGQIGGQRLVSEIQERGKLNNGKTLDYAKGLFVGEYRGLHTVRHGGAWGGYRAELLRFPGQHFSVTCLCNLSNANPERRAEKVADVYLANFMQPAKSSASTGQNEKPPSNVRLTPQQIASVTGLYRNPKDGALIRILSDNGKLKWRAYGHTFDLAPSSTTEFVPLKFPYPIKLSFQSAANSTAPEITISGDPDLAANYQQVAAFTPSTADLAAYAGDFFSDELAVVYHLRVTNGKLTLTAISDTLGIPRTGITLPIELRPSIQNEFEIEDLGVRADFQKGASDQVTGFDLNEGRAGGIAFRRTNMPQAH